MANRTPSVYNKQNACNTDSDTNRHNQRHESAIYFFLYTHKNNGQARSDKDVVTTLTSALSLCSTLSTSWSILRVQRFHSVLISVLSFSHSFSTFTIQCFSSTDHEAVMKRRKKLYLRSVGWTKKHCCTKKSIYMKKSSPYWQKETRPHRISKRENCGEWWMWE